MDLVEKKKAPEPKKEEEVKEEEPVDEGPVIPQPSRRINSCVVVSGNEMKVRIRLVHTQAHTTHEHCVHIAFTASAPNVRASLKSSRPFVGL